MSGRPALPPEERPHQRRLIDQINAELRRRGMSRNALGRQADVSMSPQTLQRIFNCTRDMTVEQWGAISAVLEIAAPRLATERPPGSVAWLATPHLADGMEQVGRGLGRMYESKDLVIAAGDDGYWVTRREGP